MMHHKDEMVQSSQNVRFSADLIAKLPKGTIKRNVTYAIEGQKKVSIRHCQ